MTIIKLNEELARIPKSTWEMEPSSLTYKAFTQGANKTDWDYKDELRINTVSEEIWRDDVPKDAEYYHSNYLGYLQTCYHKHEKVMMNPHHIWYTILCEIAQAVIKDPKKHATIFTKSPDKKIDILVPCASELEPLRMDAIYEQLVGLVPVDTKLFVPDLSTYTEKARLATLGAFLEAASPFYNYMMYACGIPVIKVGGVVEDWLLIQDNCRILSIKFKDVDSHLSPYLDSVMGILDHIINSFHGIIDKEWWKDIYTDERCGSGSDKFISGWFTKLMVESNPRTPKLENFSSHVTRVPYTTLPSKTKWHLTFMLTHSNRDANGFLVPDFSMYQVKHHATPLVTKYDRAGKLFDIEKMTIETKKKTTVK